MGSIVYQFIDTLEGLSSQVHTNLSNTIAGMIKIHTVLLIYFRLHNGCRTIKSIYKIPLLKSIYFG